MISKNYLEFVNEQKEYFLENIQPTFKNTWTDSIWVGGSNGSGWLISRSGKTYLNFGVIKRIKGINDIEINEAFQYFMKSVIVEPYRVCRRPSFLRECPDEKSKIDLLRKLI